MSDSATDTLAQLGTFSGSLTACASVPTYMVSGDKMVMIISAIGAIVAICGLIYTVVNGERSYRLQRMELEVTLKRMAEDEGDET